MKFYRQIDEAFWWDVARECPYATFFHTPLWHRLACDAYPGYRDVTVGGELENGTRLVLPLLYTGRVGKGLFRGLISTYAGCYGGIIADNPVSSADKQRLYETLKSWDLGHVLVNENPIDPAWQSPPQSSVREDFTHILKLDADFETIFSNFSKGHKSSTKKGQRMGVKVRLAETLDDYRAYFGAYQDSIERWGETATSNHPWALFEAGFNLAQQYPDQIKLWLAEVENSEAENAVGENAVIAGAWVFYWNQHIDWWHGAAYEKFFDHSPANVLQAAIIEDAIARGYQYYDFNPSGGHETVAKFKGRFGTQTYRVERATVEGRLYKILRKLSN